MKANLQERPSPIAGQWYSDDPRRLASEIDGYLQAAKFTPILGQVIAIMAPHAGHRYSGPVAAYSFAAVRNLNPDLVAVISPMHYPYSERLLTSAHTAYRTPLGSIPVDKESVTELDQALRKSLAFGLTPVANDPEHSLEIELPFLQRIFEHPFRLLPVMVRDQNLITAEALGKALASTLSSRKFLLVASTDLSHFYPQSIAHTLDEEILRNVEAFDPQGLFRAEETGKGFACGKAALAGVMWAARFMGANKAQVLHYATSGDVTGDYSQVVGYAAAAFYKAGEPNSG